MSSNDDDKRAGDLRAALERPIFNRALGKEVGTGVLDYEVYLKTNALYALQTRSTELTVPEEHLFQVMHQSQELWLKEIAFEVIGVIDALDDRRIHEACGLLDRIVVIQQCLGNEIRILQTLTPDTFQEIRRNLGNGSGLESPGYNRVLVAAEAAERSFDALIERAGISLLELYREGAARDEKRDGLKRVAELLVDWDEAFQAWLVAHFMLVRRTIGVHRKVRALDGFPTQALAPRMTKPLFAKLWDVRVELTQSWERDGGHAPGAARANGETDAPVGAPPPTPRATERPPLRVTDRPSAPGPVSEP
ncbi:MAG: Tryptophan 2,3-dioxygenase [Myxococcaceae bacterium]|nr:Tryptophan 2,3-dioxygenase [Myxococcaceae bacterium]MEA2747945.1 tryptophan 2,3-dioxygenase [Myxococcales bacterium]